MPEAAKDLESRLEDAVVYSLSTVVCPSWSPDGALGAVNFNRDAIEEDWTEDDPEASVEVWCL